MANAIAGSAYILLIASVIGVPIGIGAGIYLAEYGRNRFGDVIRFTADVLNGVPSIVIGIVAYGIVVLTQGHFSALAGGVALAIMMIPTITRTTEEMLLLVPNVVREAAYGLGVSRWRTTLIDHAAHRNFRRHHRRDAGLRPRRRRNRAATVHRLRQHLLELENQRADRRTFAPGLHLCHYRPYDDWHRQAWAGALILIVLIVLSVTAVRIAAGRGMNERSQQLWV